MPKKKTINLERPPKRPNPLENPQVHLTAADQDLLKALARRDVQTNRPANDLPVSLHLDPQGDYEGLQHLLAALIFYYRHRQLRFSYHEDVCRYALSPPPSSNIVVVPSPVAIWLDILVAEIASVDMNHYTALVRQAKTRLRTAAPGSESFGDYISRWSSPTSSTTPEHDGAAFDDWFANRQQQDPVKPMYSFAYRSRANKAADIAAAKAALAAAAAAAAQEASTPNFGKKCRKINTSKWLEWMKPFKTYVDFVRTTPSRFQLIVKNGIEVLEQYYGVKFTREKILAAAQYCRHKSEFTHNYPGMIVISRRLNCYDELMNILVPVPGRQTLLDGHSTPFNMADIDEPLQPAPPIHRQFVHYTEEELVEYVRRNGIQFRDHLRVQNRSMFEFFWKKENVHILDRILPPARARKD